jgi:maltose/maltodextrin transport system substrate-binding protein
MRASLRYRLLLALTVLSLWPLQLSAWTNGQLLIWMDSERAQGLRPILEKFTKDWGVSVTIDSPANIVNNFLLAAEARQGPDIVIWAHDKVGEWADGGLIARVEPPPGFIQNLYPRAWLAVQHRDSGWGYPLTLEAVTLICNKKLLVGRPPTDLSQLPSIDRVIQNQHPGTRTILWDYKNPYYSWGILASDGGYSFKRVRTNYDTGHTGLLTPGAIEGLSQIVALVRNGILPLGPVSGQGLELMARGKLAMTMSGPWDWPNLIASGIDFSLAPVPGVAGQPGRPFIGVQVAYINSSSPNGDLAKQFLEQYLVTDEGLLAMNRIRPIGVPALIELYEKLSRNDSRLRQLKAALDYGELMPNIPQMGRFFTALGSALEIATDGQTSARVALRDAAATIQGR